MNVTTAWTATTPSYSNHVTDYNIRKIFSYSMASLLVFFGGEHFEQGLLVRSRPRRTYDYEESIKLFI